MARIKRGTTVKRRHKKILSQAKGYRMTKHRLIRKAKEAVLHAGQYAFIGRKQRKRNFRTLWIVRISGALKQMDMTYSRFINALKRKNILLNRKILADMAANEPESFKQLVEQVKV